MCRALLHINVLARLRNPVVSRGCVIVHTPAATNLYFKDACSTDHALSNDLLNALGREAFISLVEAIQQILEDLCDGVSARACDGRPADGWGQ